MLNNNEELGKLNARANNNRSKKQRGENETKRRERKKEVIILEKADEMVEAAGLIKPD
jgi:hypothetical protein